MNPKEDRALIAQLDEYTRNGWIEPAHSAFGAGVRFAKKHDGGLRLCIDYRRLNVSTQKVVYPIPRIDECPDSLAGSRVSTKMELRSGFRQILSARFSRLPSQGSGRTSGLHLRETSCSVFVCFPPLISSASAAAHHCVTSPECVHLPQLSGNVRPHSRDIGHLKMTQNFDSAPINNHVEMANYFFWRLRRRSG